MSTLLLSIMEAFAGLRAVDRRNWEETREFVQRRIADRIVRGPQAEVIAGQISNRRVWRNDSFSEMGLVGIDHNILWIYSNPTASSPVFRIALSETVKLLYTLFQLIPSDEGVSIAKSLSNNEAPFGSCELCSQPLWPQPNQFRTFSVSCVKHPYQSRKLTCQDATRYAQFTSKTCEICGSSLRGMQSKSQGKIFLGCSRFTCQGKIKLDQLI